MKTTYITLTFVALMLAVDNKQAKADVPQQSLDELWQNALAIFGQIDTNGDLHLSTKELGQAVEKRNPEFKGKDAQTVAALYLCRDLIMSLNDLLGKELDQGGITRTAITKLSKHDPEHDTEDAAIIDALFQLADNSLFLWADYSPSDSFLSTDEIISILRNNKNLAEMKQKTLGYMLAHMTQIASCYDDGDGEDFPIVGTVYTGVSKEDINCYLKQNRNALILAIEQHVMWTAELTSRSQKDWFVRSLFCSTKFPQGSVLPDAVIQHQFPNCSWHAAVASLAANNPMAIINMIHDNGDGTCTITFPGDKYHPYLVPSIPTEAEMGISSGGSQYGTWACALEKAFACFRQKHYPLSINPDCIQADGANAIITPEEAIALLTGKQARIWFSRPVGDMLNDKVLTEAITNGLPIVCANYDASEHNKNGFVTHHAYSILKFDPKGPDGGTVTLRNPWGTYPNQVLSLNELLNNFSNFDIGTSTPVSDHWFSVIHL